ncbi:MAG: peptidoglycan-binding protein [Alphaproteobacteria bacterium]
MDLQKGFEAVAPRAPEEVSSALADMAPRLEAMGMTTTRRWAALLGQTGHESSGFTRRTEGLWYTAPRLQAVWPAYFGDPRIAERYAKDPEALANYIYGVKRARRLGNIMPEDGYRFRGRGWIQITGRDNYDRAARALDIDLVNQPELAERPDIAFVIAAWFLKVHGRYGRTALEWADLGNWEMVTRVVNPRMYGLEDRRQKTARAFIGLSASDPAARPTLRLGDTEVAVVVLQELLAQISFNPGPIDGGFGGMTEDAVLAFQRHRRLTIDGVVGRNTWRELDRTVAQM